MTDDWRYKGDDARAVRAGREYMEVCKDLDAFDTAADLLLKYSEHPTVLDNVRKRLCDRMDVLNPELNGKVVCDSCWGARREGHGERCGRCGGDGQISVGLRVGR